MMRVIRVDVSLLEMYVHTRWLLSEDWAKEGRLPGF
jgi:hypothetical protein